jgi:hypothetical protein
LKTTQRPLRNLVASLENAGKLFIPLMRQVGIFMLAGVDSGDMAQNCPRIGRVLTSTTDCQPGAAGVK